jgi:WhiB family transcriptional regulator, redox-sensing transcriptional regulator
MTSDGYWSSPERADDWRDRAACAGIGYDLFFPEHNSGIGDARKVCRDCPVRAQCLTFAIETDQRHGVWGGITQGELRKLVLKKNRSAS